MSKLAALIGQAGNPISRAPKRLTDTPVTLARERLLELEALLHLRDGFVTCDGALVVRPSVTVAAVYGVEGWNQLTLWRTPYSKSTELMFFSEDRFGRQYALLRDEVVVFDPITAQHEHLGFSLERWAEHVLDPSDPIGRIDVAAWQLEHGPLGLTQRLQPRVPERFADQAIDIDDPTELRVIEDVELMRRYARLFQTTRERPGMLPEGFDEWWWSEGKSA